jgi:group I intron endonuclease
MKLLAYTNEKLEHLYQTGVYKIVNKISGKFYIGSAARVHHRPSCCGFYSRWTLHISDLNRNLHHCQPLQRAWHKYGEDAFDFIILEFVESEKCEEVEQTYLDNTDKKQRYNTKDRTNSNLGVKASDETRKKMSDSSSKPFRLVSPLGEVVEGTNAYAFAKENNLENSGLYRVMQGLKLHCKGWTASLEAHLLYLEGFASRGITWDKSKSLWKVSKRIDYKSKDSYFQTKEEAINFRDSLVLEGHDFKVCVLNWKEKLNAKENS